MTSKLLPAMLLTGLASALPCQGDPLSTSIGGDTLVSGSRFEQSTPAVRDLLVSGAQVTTTAEVGQDLFAAGLSVDIEGRSGGDVSAIGARVRVNGTVGGDVTLSGLIVTLDEGAKIAGNARLFGGTATQHGIIDGALVVAASEVRIDGRIAGDVEIIADSLAFGPDARVDGQLKLALPVEMAVPPEVAPSGRVTWRYLEAGDWRDMNELDWGIIPERPSPLALGGGYLLVLAFLLIVGGTFLTLMPGEVATMRRMALNRPGISVLLGGLAFSAIVGAVPVSLLSIVGWPLVPIAILLVILAWTVGYLLGTYIVAMGIARALGAADAPSLPMRLTVLAAAVTGFALLNFVPFLGWILNICLVFLGLGAIAEALLRAMMPAVDPGPHDEMMADPS